ncbi:ABC transporter permease subunit [Saccharibacillus sp. CPCC 101409]|uniref:ABC transporter permease n=1 Tax=Saccharibacillus sp. CPCC 101409 TaxID=3058041 RepID=UPI0026721269|nr:ABC transporter permease [Saccharibacillus sp. CPCC 101409]MDO3412588.1 ABC transporter permease subunit [Saccharibacillus sp. CPCC 101409]
MRLIKNELYKVFKLNKLYFFMVISAALMIVQAAAELSNPSAGANVLNGQSFPLWMLSRIMPLFIFFMALTLAEMISDEYRSGTLKLFLLRPVGRIGLLNAKLAALAVSVLILLLVVMAEGYIVGTAFWGWGDRLVADDAAFSTLRGIGITLQSYAFTALPCLGFGMVITLVAIRSSSMGGTIGISLGVMFILTALENVRSLNPYSIVHQMNLYRSLIGDAGSSNLSVGLLNIAAYLLVFYGISIVTFKKKDLLI